MSAEGSTVGRQNMFPFPQLRWTYSIGYFIVHCSRFAPVVKRFSNSFQKKTCSPVHLIFHFTTSFLNRNISFKLRDNYEKCKKDLTIF